MSKQSFNGTVNLDILYMRLYQREARLSRLLKMKESLAPNNLEMWEMTYKKERQLITEVQNDIDEYKGNLKKEIEAIDKSTRTESNHVSVLESEEYDDEIRILMKDPIIISMANEVFSGDETGRFFSSRDEHQVTLISNKEYVKRGGTNCKSLGGPLRAIRMLIDPDRKVV